MYIYAKTMYDAWCNGQDYFDVRDRYNIFVKLASERFALSEEEMENFLRGTRWFICPPIEN